MISSASGTLLVKRNPERPPFVKLWFLLTIIVVIFGKPNTIFLYLPVYPWIVLGFIIFLVLLVSIVKIAKDKITLPRINLWIPIILFFLMSFASLSYAPDRQFGLRILASMVTKVILFGLIVDFCKSFRDLHRVLKIISVFSTIFAVQAIFQVIAVGFLGLRPIGNFGTVDFADAVVAHYNLDNYGVLGVARGYFQIGSLSLPRAHAMFLEPGWFANFLELSIFTTFAYMALQPRGNRWLLRLMLAWQIGALLLTFSTAGWVAAILGGGSCIFFRYGRLSPVVKRSLKFLLIGVVLVALAFLVIPSITHTIYSLVWLEKFETPWQRASFPHRLEGYKSALALFRDKPIFGWGTNQLRIVAGGANNALLTVAAELGTVGLLIYLSMLGAIAKVVFSNVRLARSIDNPNLTSMTAYIAGGVVALVAHSMLVDTNWSFFYWIGLSLLYVNHRLLVRGEI